MRDKGRYARAGLVAGALLVAAPACICFAQSAPAGPTAAPAPATTPPVPLSVVPGVAVPSATAPAAASGSAVDPNAITDVNAAEAAAAANQKALDALAATINLSKDKTDALKQEIAAMHGDQAKQDAALIAAGQRVRIAQIEVQSMQERLTDLATAEQDVRTRLDGADASDGEMVSKLGQVVSGVYGDDRSKYDVLVAFQTVGNPASQVARLTAANYVANGPAQDGFTQSPASDWATCGCIAQYWQPSAYGQALEATLNTAVQGGDQTAPGRYIDTAASGGIVTVDAVITIHAGYKTFLQAHGINKLCGYEGGYSPDINGTNTPIRIAGKGATSGQVYKGGIYHAAQSVYDGVTALADDSFKIDGLSVFLFAGPLPDNNAWTIQADIYQPVSDQCKSFALYNAGKRRYTVGVHG